MDIVDDRNQDAIGDNRITDDRKPVEKSPGMFSSIKQFGKDIGASTIETIDATAALTHGATMFLPGLGAETMAIGRGIVDPKMTIREARDQAVEAASKVTLQPGMITKFSKEFFDIGQQPEIPESVVKKVSHGIEVMVPSEQIEKNLAQFKELDTFIPDEVIDVAAFGMAKFIELLAFKGYHEVGAGGIKKVKSKIEGMKRRIKTKKLTQEEFTDLADDIKGIDLKEIKDPDVKAEVEGIKTELESVVRDTKEVHERVVEEVPEEAKREMQIEREKLNKLDEQVAESGETKITFNEPDPNYKPDVVLKEAKDLGVDIRFEDTGGQQGFGKLPARQLYTIMEKGRETTMTFPEDASPEFIRKAIKDKMVEYDKAEADIKKPAESIVEEETVFQDNLEKLEGEAIKSGEKPFDDLIIKGDIIPKDKMTEKRRKLLKELTDEDKIPSMKDRTYKYVKEPDELMQEIDALGEVMREWIEKPGDTDIILNVEKELKSLISEAPTNDPRFVQVNEYVDRILTGIDHIKVEKQLGDRADILLDAKRPLKEKLEAAETKEDIVETTMSDIFDMADDSFSKGVGRDSELLAELMDSVKEILKDERGSISTGPLPPERVQQLRNIIKAAKEEGIEVLRYLLDAGYSEKEALIVDEFINRQMQKELKEFDAKDFSDAKSKLDQAKKTAVQMEIDKRIIDNTPKEKLSEFHQYLLDQGVIVKGYKKGSYELPQHMKSGINVERVPKIKKDIKKDLASPHYQFEKAFDLIDNPVIDMQQSNIAFHTNISNYSKWKQDLFKRFDKDKKDRLKRISDVLDPVYEKYRPDINKRNSIGRQIDVIKRQIKKSPKDKKKKYEERLEKLKLQSKNIGKRLKGLPEDYDINIVKLYNEPVVKATLHAGGQLPQQRIKSLNEYIQGVHESNRSETLMKSKRYQNALKKLEQLKQHPEVKLNADEMFLSRRLKEYFLTKKEHLQDVGIPIDKKETYMTRLWNSVLDNPKDVGFFKKLKAPEIMDFQRQMPNGRIWIPDASQILDVYIPMVEKKLAHQPFFNRFAQTMAGADTGLRSLYNEWIDKNLYRKHETGVSRLMEHGVDKLVDFEYLRLIGASLSVGLKHLLKLPGTFAIYSTKANIQASKLAFKAAGQAFKKTFGREPKGHELDVISAFIKQKNIVAELDQIPGFREGSQRVKALLAQPTVAIEAFENGINVMAGIMSGVGKMPMEKVQKAIWKNILDSNFRGQSDQALWMKGTGARAFTMFTMTPIKLLEYKYDIIKKALKGEKDVFGTSYRTRFMRYLMYVGIAESIARANDTSVLELFLHPPFISHFIKPTEKGFKFANPDIYMSPVLDLYSVISQKGLFEGTEEHFQYWGTASKVANAWNKSYPTDYYDSWAKQLVSLPKIDSKSHKKKKRSGGIGGISSGLKGGL